MQRLPFVLAACAAVALSAPAPAADWAATIVSYTPGSTYPAPDPGDWSFVPPAGAVNASYTSTTSSILAGITADTGYGVLTPFNGPFSTDHYLGVGAGGSIILQFADPVRTDGYTIGIHTASGLIDFDYPNGNAGMTATAYTTPRRATLDVRVDAAGDWLALGTFDLNNPSNFYATGVDTPGYQAAVAGAMPADVTQPFLGSLSSFNGQNWSQILTTLNGSAGGTWLDLSSLNVPAISYIRFTVPTGSVLYLDGVVGLPAPEPTSLTLLGLGGLVLLRRRRNAA